MAHSVSAQRTCQWQQRDQVPVLSTEEASTWKRQATRYDAPLQNHSLFNALRRHGPEYLMEGTELGLFMLSACAFVVLLEHPNVRQHDIDQIFCAKLHHHNNMRCIFRCN